MKKAHTLPLFVAALICCFSNFYTFRRPDVKMNEKRPGVNRKNGRKGEEYSGKVKILHDEGQRCLTSSRSPQGEREGLRDLQQLRQAVNV
ncbi:TPA: hypothetical protein ACXE9F_001875 [Pluralibacter gergoviae]